MLSGHRARMLVVAPPPCSCCCRGRNVPQKGSVFRGNLVVGSGCEGRRDLLRRPTTIRGCPRWSMGILASSKMAACENLEEDEKTDPANLEFSRETKNRGEQLLQ